MERHIDDFINYLIFIEQLSKNTVDSYRRDLEQFSKYLMEDDLKFDQINHHHLLSFLNTLQKEQSSLARMASSLRRFYGYLKTSRVIVSDPTQFLQVKSPTQKIPNILSLSDFQQLISFEKTDPIDYLDTALIEMLYSSGLRASECISIKIQQIFLDERILRIMGKRNKVRVVVIGQKAIEALNDYFEFARNVWLQRQSDYLFINKKGEPLSRHYLYNMLQRRKKETGLLKDVSPHILRHSFASELINHGADLRVIQELLGHSDVKTTQIYTHLDFKAKARQYQNFHPGDKIKTGKETKEDE